MSPRRKYGPAARRRRWFLALGTVLLTYGLCEAVATFFYLRGTLEPTRHYFHERTDPRGNVRRDRVIGYRLSQTPARLVVVSSQGEVLSRGQLRGTSDGFPDREEFTRRKRSPEEIRIGVLGDSFTASQFTAMNWPELTQALLAERGAGHVRLFNLAIDGGGLGNWWSILRGFVERSELELDGLVFAVCCNDLDRRFVWWDDTLHAGYDVHPPAMMVRYSDTWDPDVDPFGPGESLLPFARDWWRILPAEDFARRLGDGDWDVHWTRRFELYFWKRLSAMLGMLTLPPAWAGPATRSPDDEARLQREVLAAMGRWVKARQLPVLVIDISAEEGAPLTVQDLVQALDAAYLDTAPRGLCGVNDEEEKLPIDGHWNDRGVDCFSRYVAEPILEWTRGF